MIKSFRCKETEKLFNRELARRFPFGILQQARRKLLMLDAASELQTLSIPPANRLEKLRGKRAGDYSIRINDQWRICFRWLSGDAYDVEIVDYH